MSIVELTEKYVRDYLCKNLSSECTFHSPEHTFGVVDNVKILGNGLKISKGELEIVILAAWFHDVGYTQKCDGHEKISAKLAESFLINNNYPPSKIIKVIDCIYSTRLGYSPKNLLEKIMSDADLLHIGKECCVKTSLLLKKEIELKSGKKITNKEWLISNIQFLKNNKFKTEYAIEKYNTQRLKNIKLLEEELINNRKIN